MNTSKAISEKIIYFFANIIVSFLLIGFYWFEAKTHYFEHVSIPRHINIEDFNRIFAENSENKELQTVRTNMLLIMQKADEKTFTLRRGLNSEQEKMYFNTVNAFSSLLGEKYRRKYLHVKIANTLCIVQMFCIFLNAIKFRKCFAKQKILISWSIFFLLINSFICFNIVVKWWGIDF